MNDYKDRLQQAMDRAEKKTPELSKATGVSVQAIYKLLNGKSKSMSAEHNEAAAAFLGVSSRWLATGKGTPEVSQQNVTRIGKTVTVPLLSWDFIHKTGGIVSDISCLQKALERAVTRSDAYRPDAFALAVQGDSMVGSDQNQASFPAGTLIFVDPGEAAKAGDYVLATDPESKEPTFKRLMQDGGRWFLRPLNTAYPTTEIESPAACVIGRVYEYQIHRTL